MIFSKSGNSYLIVKLLPSWRYIHSYHSGKHDISSWEYRTIWYVLRPLFSLFCMQHPLCPTLYTLSLLLPWTDHLPVMKCAWRPRRGLLEVSSCLWKLVQPLSKDMAGLINYPVSEDTHTVEEPSQSKELSVRHSMYNRRKQHPDGLCSPLELAGSTFNIQLRSPRVRAACQWCLRAADRTAERVPHTAASFRSPRNTPQSSPRSCACVESCSFSSPPPPRCLLCLLSAVRLRRRRLCVCLQVRVIIYTVLSLVPFVLLLPFLGGRELMPLDPSQM